MSFINSNTAGAASTPVPTQPALPIKWLKDAVLKEWNSGQNPNLKNIQKLLRVDQLNLKYPLDMSTASRLEAIKKEYNNGDRPNMSAVNELLLGYTDGKSPYLTKVPKDGTHSWAFIAGHGVAATQNSEAFEGAWLSNVDIEFIKFKRARKAAILRIKVFRYFDLPFEMRALVLEHVAGKRTIPVFLRGVHGFTPTSVPVERGTTACRQMWLEGSLATLKSAKWEIHSGPGNASFQNWLSNFDFSNLGNPNIKNGFDAVQKLSFPFFSRYPHHTLSANALNNDIELMLKCRNLREVTMLFHPQELQHIPPGQGFIVDKDVNLLRAQYRLSMMRYLPSIKTITLQGPAEGSPGHLAMEAIREDFALIYHKMRRLTGVEIVLA